MEGTWYALIQWEDRYMSVINVNNIVKPVKKPKEYNEGDLVSAKYGHKLYKAVICELHPNKKYLDAQAKLPPKVKFTDVERIVYPVQTQDQTNTNTMEMSKEKTVVHPVQTQDQTNMNTMEMSKEKTVVYPVQTQDQTNTNTMEMSKEKTVEIDPEPECPQLLLKQTGKVMSPQVSKKDFDDLVDQVRRLKKRVRDLEKRKAEKDQSPLTSSPSSPTSTSPPPAKCLKEDSMPSGQYNGHTMDELKTLILCTEGLFNCVKTLLQALFSVQYILTHSVTGRRANTMLSAKPKFDSYLYNCFSKIIKEKFESVKDTEITIKVQTVQKSLKKTMK